MKTRAGSVAVFVLFMVASTMIVVIATVSLSGALRGKQTRLEQNRIVQNLFDGAMEVCRDMAFRGVLRLPQTVTTTLNGTTVTVSLSDASNATSISLFGIALTTNTGSFIKASATLTYNGLSYKTDRVIDRGVLTTIWQYALYSDSSFSTSSTINTGAAAGTGGDVFIDGSVSWSNLNRIRGDLTSTGSISASLTTVDGKKNSNSSGITWPQDNSTDYKNAASSTLAAASLNGYSFPSATTSGYPILYCDNDLSVSGSFTGTGIIYIRGNGTLTGDITISAGSHLLIICHGNLTVNSSVSTVGAYVYCDSTMTVNSSLSSTTFTCGVAAKNFKTSAPTVLNYDPWVRDFPSEAYKFRLPGVWP